MLAGHSPEMIMEIARYDSMLSEVGQSHFGIIKPFKKT
jgi:hypothetical protein